MTTARAVLWDLDGTLVDSAGYHWRAWRDTMKAEGIDLTHETFLDSFGRKNASFLGGWLGDAATGERIARIGDAKESDYRRLVAAGGLTPLPGAAAWVARLHAAGWRQAVASSAPRANVEVMLYSASLDRAFDAIVGAEDVTEGKPDPQVFLAAASALAVPPSHCIVVEDAAAGIEAARRAGMRCIGVSGTSVLPADVFVRSLDQLHEGAFEALLRDRG
ncbi:MAG: HAD family phosphatase [Acidobacteriota bacterium]